MCDKCNETGWLEHTEYEEHFGSMHPMIVSEMCDECLERGYCPICGGEMHDDPDKTAHYQWLYCPNCERWWRID